MHLSRLLLRAHAPVVLVAVLAALALPSAASASSPLAVVGPTAPTTSASTDGPVPFEVDVVSGALGTPIGADVEIEIATQNQTGADGTLANDYRVDLFPLTQGDLTPTVYRGTGHGDLWQTPGTYYWQVEASYTDPTTQTLVQEVSPVFTLIVTGTPVVVTIAAAPAATPVASPRTTLVGLKKPAAVPAASKVPYRMTLDDLATDLTTTLAQHDRGAEGLTRACNRETGQTFRCVVSWRDRTARVSGVLRITDTGDFRSTFSGVKTATACLRASTVKLCARPYRWSI